MQTVALGNVDRSLRSLWFEAGLWYTLTGSGQLTLGQGLEDNGTLLVVNSPGLQAQSEHNIENRVRITDVGGYGRIENYSEGGLRIGGTFDLNGRSVRIGGTGATHLANTISGAGNIEVGPAGGFSTQPQLILSGSQPQWNGSLVVNSGGFAILKTFQALGYGGEKRVYDGGSLALRSHLEMGLHYDPPVNAPDQPLLITGAGITRRAETEQIGALYNDGGENRFDMRVEFAGDTLFGARGDREGGLTLGGRVYNAGEGRFIKVGPGLIALGNSATGTGANSWSGGTVIRGGVLRLGSAGALPTGTNLVFEGGILELGDGDFTRGLGTGNNQLRWAGSGGFSAYGADRSVTISGAPQFYWGTTDPDLTPHFLKDGDALLLSSRYATHNITFTNHVQLGRQAREIRVERGVGNAHAIMSGMVYGFANSAIRKTGRGLLHLSILVGGGGESPQRMIIEDGAVRYPLSFGLYSSNYNTRLAGGVLGIEGDYTRTLGPNDGQIQWIGSGGFAAYGGGTRTVTFTGQGALPWGGGRFVGDEQELRFGHYTADGTVSFAHAIDLGSNKVRVIRIERGSAPERADVLLGDTKGSSDLWLVGDGRIDFRGLIGLESSGPTLNIFGAEVRIHGQGHLSRETITLRHGGTLFLDDLGKHDSESGGQASTNRIRDDATLHLQGGTLVYRRANHSSASEKIKAVAVDAGENSIMLFPTNTAEGELRAETLVRGTGSRGTLHFWKLYSLLRLDTSASGHAINDSKGTGIIPWAVFAGGAGGWATVVPNGTGSALKALDAYEVGAESGWAAAHNVLTSGGQMLGANRTINSLILGGGDLGLGSGSGNGHTLTINSGGLIAINNGTRGINGSGQITTSNSRPFYVHTFGNLTFGGSARFSGGMDLVKSQSGTLTLDSNVTHTVGNVYIHRGILDLKRGTLSVNGRIWIGDGSGRSVLVPTLTGNAILKLAPNRWNQIVKTGGGLASITLNGTPYDPRGPEYGGAQAILQMGGNTKQSLANLHIENRGTIDWVGGEVGRANILWIDTLTFSSPDAQLFIRNWYEYEDIL
ncbi:hypothetical protein, partial [Cephaloticoccus primus]|uniref:hypothetical protein n=1 Tax=Cephaloticoccus primus TaxID=1548207 RepID=UPI0018D3D191